MIGHFISHYKIVSKIGHGGMGIVYKAEDTKLKRHVALKFLSSEFTQDEDASKRFIQEAQTTSALDHQNICTIYEIDETADGQMFIVMAYYEGETLKNKIKNGTLEINEVIDIGTQIAQGLKKAHEKGIVHRDIKPGNIIITNDGVVKILDFGLAKLSKQSSFTRSGSTLGTVSYMSPEQVQGLEVDHRTDIWSLGVVMYEMLTGQLPFTGEVDQAVMYAIVNHEPQTLNLRSDIPSEISQIVTKSLEKNPKNRYTTIIDLISDILSFSKQFTTSEKIKLIALNLLFNIRNSRWLLPLLSVVLIFLMITVSIILFLPNKKDVFTNRKMIAVLPFENLGPSEDEWFAEAISDEISTRLSGLHELAVIARQSTIQYKNSEKSIKEIGEELGVNYILEGTLQRENPKDFRSKIRVRPKLINVVDNILKWSESYDGNMSDVFHLQTDISEQVAEKLEILLLDNERDYLIKKPTDNQEAYEFYLKGNNFYYKPPNRQNRTYSLQMYEKAVELDPDFALAWAALSKVRIWCYWQYEQKNLLIDAKDAIDRAFYLDKDLPEASFALGVYYYRGFRNYELALNQLNIALKSRPNNSEIHKSIGEILRRQGKFEESVNYLKKAVILNPQEHRAIFVLGYTLLLMHRYSEAEYYFDRHISLNVAPSLSYIGKLQICFSQDQSVKKAKDLTKIILDDYKISMADFIYCGLWMTRILPEFYTEVLKRLSLKTNTMSKPRFSNFFLRKAVLYEFRGLEQLAHIYYDSARIVKESIFDEWSDDELYHVELGLMYAGLNRKEEAIREGLTSATMLPVTKDAIYGPTILNGLAEIYVMLGEYESAIDQLELTLSMPSLMTSGVLKLDPIWNPLREHPRFKLLLENY